MEESVSGMGQLVKHAAMKDAPTKSKKEVSVGDMGRRRGRLYDNICSHEGCINHKSSKEESVCGIEGSSHTPSSP